MIRSKIREMVGVTIGLTEYEHIRDTLCDQIINYGIRRAELDLLKLGFKGFTKKVVYSAPVFDAPSDLLAIPNSIIEVKVGAGTRGLSSVTLNPNGLNNSVCVFTLIEPTEETVTVSFTSGGAPACTSVGRIVRITYDSGGTVAQLMTFLNSNPVFRGLFLYASASNASVIPDLQEDVAITGTGFGWRVAKEVSIEDYDDLSSNEFKRATALTPVYKRTGDVDGVHTIELSPDTITSVMMTYHYRLADMSYDSEESPIPAEYEELLIADVSARCYSVLKTVEGLNMKVPEYTNRIAELRADYQLLLEAKFGEKVRLLNTKPND